MENLFRGAALVLDCVATDGALALAAGVIGPGGAISYVGRGGRIAPGLHRVAALRVLGAHPHLGDASQADRGGGARPGEGHLLGD